MMKKTLFLIIGFLLSISSYGQNYTFLGQAKIEADSFYVYRGASSGGGNFADTTYTSANPFTLTTAAGRTALPNNAGSIWGLQVPVGHKPLYDGATIAGINGNMYQITIEFRVRPTSAASDPRISTVIDIGGSVGELYKRDLVLSKGNGVEHYYVSSFVYYTLDTWEENGGTVYVTAFNSDLEIYDIRYVIALAHMAR